MTVKPTVVSHDTMPPAKNAYSVRGALFANQSILVSQVRTFPGT